MYFVVYNAENQIVMRGQSSEMVDPPIEKDQRFEWHSAPLPIADLDSFDPVSFLEETRNLVDREIREEAETQRLRFISPGAGKAMAYQQKAFEADQFVADGSPTADKYPHIYGEAEAIGIEPAAMAAMVLRLRDQWQQASAMIERIERVGILAVQQASTIDEVQSVRAVDWTMVDELARAFE